MKILFNSLLIIVAAGVGFALGFALRGRAVSTTAGLPADQLPAATVSERRRSRVSYPPVSARNNDDSPLTTKLERDVSMSSGVTRWLYWLEAIEKAVPADFPRLLQLAQGNVLFPAEDGIRYVAVTGVQTCALPISAPIAWRWIFTSARKSISKRLEPFPSHASQRPPGLLKLKRPGLYPRTFASGTCAYKSRI